MTHIYKVTGMTCNGCKSSLEKALLSINHVESVAIDLERSEANITLSSPIATEILQQAIPEKFTISEKDNQNGAMTISEDKSELKQLFPLFLIFGYISITSILLNYNPWNVKAFMLDFMGMFYIVFSFFKLLDLKGFPKSFRMYDPLAKAIPAYGWIYPFVEVILGLMFLMRIQIPIALITTLIILSITTFGVTKALLDKKSIQCACLGIALKLPMTKATFIENSVMLIMAVFMLIKTYN